MNNEKDFLVETPSQNLDTADDAGLQTKLSAIRLKNQKGLIVAHLNINSIRNKFDDLKFLVTKNVDIMIISETKLDESFPESQFLVDGFKKPFRLYRTANGGGLLVYVRDKVPTKEIKQIHIPNAMECLLTEINVSKKKWALLCAYRPLLNVKFFSSMRWAKY